MKKILIITVLFILLITSYGFSQMKLGLFGGYNFFLEDVLRDATAGGISFGAKLGYGIDNITIGLLTGYFQMMSETINITLTNGLLMGDSSMFDIPILAFGQISFGNLYALGGLGFHFITATSDVATTAPPNAIIDIRFVDGSSSDFGATIGLGYEMDLGIADLEIGGLFHMIFFTEMQKMFTLHAGINFNL